MKATFDRDDWLSEQLGRPAYSLPAGAWPVDLAQAVAALPSGAFISTKVDVADLAATAALEDAGFRIVDVNVRFAVTRDRLVAQADDRPRFAIADDAHGVTLLAGRAFQFSRFHLDPAITTDEANRVKAAWAGNFFSGARGEWMVVAGGDRVEGFLQLLTTPDGLVVDLIAVAPELRRTGLAASMIGFAATACGDSPMIYAGTQAANRASIRLYEALGFRWENASYVLHAHRK
jgi:ribosomal protein S18 acetylase RimI-like enzyme